MDETVEAYKEKKPDLEINVVPQSTATLISSFQAAASAGQGPDIASQWATGPVLAQEKSLPQQIADVMWQ